MPKRNYEITQNTINKRLKEGRGKGIGSTYKPWVTINDVPSKGRSCRDFGIKTHRIHHFLSDLERNFFFMCEWDETIIDIREHFPLDRVVALELSEKYNIPYPTNISEKEPTIVTTDFLLTVYSEDYKGDRDIAVSVMYSTDLEKTSNLNILELQRRYWSELDVPFFVFTNKEVNKTVVDNIKWLHSSYSSMNESTYLKYEPIISIILDRICNSTLTITELLNSIDMELSLESGTALSVFKILLAHKTIKFDISKKITMTESCSSFLVNLKERSASNL